MNNGYSGIFSNPVFSNPAIPVQKRLPVYTQRAGRLGPQFNVRPTPPNWPGASVRGLSGFGALGAASITSAGSCVAYKESYAALADANVLPAVLQNLVGVKGAPSVNGGPWEGLWTLVYADGTIYKMVLYQRDDSGWVVGASWPVGSTKATRIAARITNDNTVVGSL